MASCWRYYTYHHCHQGKLSNQQLPVQRVREISSIWHLRFSVISADYLFSGVGQNWYTDKSSTKILNNSITWHEITSSSGNMAATWHDSNDTTKLCLRTAGPHNYHSRRASRFWGFKCPDNKVHGANMGPTWVLSAPDGPHVGPMNLAIRDALHI